jgi:hypothetical protein
MATVMLLQALLLWLLHDVWLVLVNAFNQACVTVSLASSSLSPTWPGQVHYYHMQSPAHFLTSIPCTSASQGWDAPAKGFSLSLNKFSTWLHEEYASLMLVSHCWAAAQHPCWALAVTASAHACPTSCHAAVPGAVGAWCLLACHVHGRLLLSCC